MPMPRRFIGTERSASPNRAAIVIADCGSAGVRPLKPGDTAQRRGLAATAGAEQREERPGGSSNEKSRTPPAFRVGLVAEDFRQAAHTQHVQFPYTSTLPRRVSTKNTVAMIVISTVQIRPNAASSPPCPFTH